MKDFDEKKHPRDEEGKFTEAGGETQYRQNTPYEEITESDGADSQKHRAKHKKRYISDEEFFGTEFAGLKGSDAIEKLLSEKKGHVKAAFFRPEIGDITLVWGNDDGGLLHSMQKRDKLLRQGIGHISGADMARKIPEIMEKGQLIMDDKGRIGIEHDGYLIGIRPTYYEKKINWIVTAMEIFGK